MPTLSSTHRTRFADGSVQKRSQRARNWTFWRARDSVRNFAACVRPVYRGPMPPGTTSRLVSKALAACLMLALSVFPVSCASTESTPMRTPTPDNPWPDSTRARVQECVEQGVSDLPEGHNSVQFDLFVTPDGLVQEVRAKGSELAAHDVQICINQALKAMRVPAFVWNERRRR